MLSKLALALALRNLHFRPTIAEANLSALDARHESHVYPSILVRIAHLPYLQYKLVPRLYWASEPSGKLLDVIWVGLAK